MRLFVAGTLIVPLFVAISFILFAVDASISGGALGSNPSFWKTLAIAFVLSFVTAFLLFWRFTTRLTFQWLYWLGMACLSLALLQILKEFGCVQPWDPYNIGGYHVLTHALGAVTALVLGLISIITAVIQDFVCLWHSQRIPAAGRDHWEPTRSSVKPGAAI